MTERLRAKLPPEKTDQLTGFSKRSAESSNKLVSLLFFCYSATLFGTEEEAVHWDTGLHLRLVNPPLYLSLGQWFRPAVKLLYVPYFKKNNNKAIQFEIMPELLSCVALIVTVG